MIRAFGLPSRTCAVELDLDALIAWAPSTGQIRSLSSHPAVKQDVALVVDSAVSASDVQQSLQEGAGTLLESVALFDIYTGDQIDSDKKSLAFNLVFRATDRTLTEAEATAARDQAVAEATRRTGALLRS